MDSSRGKKLVVSSMSNRPLVLGPENCNDVVALQQSRLHSSSKNKQGGLRQERARELCFLVNLVVHDLFRLVLTAQELQQCPRSLLSFPLE